VVTQTAAVDVGRGEMLAPRAAVTVSTMSRRDLENLPQGGGISVSDLVYQFPGVSQESMSAAAPRPRDHHER
jgi:hypothetical protein